MHHPMRVQVGVLHSTYVRLPLRSFINSQGTGKLGRRRSNGGQKEVPDNGQGRRRRDGRQREDERKKGHPGTPIRRVSDGPRPLSLWSTLGATPNPSTVFDAHLGILAQKASPLGPETSRMRRAIMSPPLCFFWPSLHYEKRREAKEGVGEALDQQGTTTAPWLLSFRLWEKLHPGASRPEMISAPVH
ncbi:hypothetical protein LZ32DRAFT_305680 [Colletotrichum eremochloae]|nr:hypothetical protein LZ32DRAFT_305680 [Colletotrichum eremochloae]